jgi:hypothetical protein
MGGESLNGYQTKKKCPQCEKGLLFTNDAGNKWCSSSECDYHIKKSGEKRRYSRDVMMDDKEKNFSKPFKRF